MNIGELYIVNYCHPNCQPLQNIMRLPRDEAFALAGELARQNQETTAFYRFADFDNYYPERLRTDELLYARFTELGGRPVERHPLSFVLQGSEYLNGWFGNGTVTKIPLSTIPESDISFTYGDSMSSLKKRGSLIMRTKGQLLGEMAAFSGGIEGFLPYVETEYHYIEVQLWNDECLKLCEKL